MKKNITILIALSCLLYTSCRNESEKQVTETTLNDTIQKRDSAITVSIDNVQLPDTSLEKLKLLLETNEAFKLPTKLDTLVKTLGKWNEVEYVSKDEIELSPWGAQYIWHFPNNLTLIAQSDNITKPYENDVRAIFMSTSSNAPISDLVYNLSLNTTTKADCANLFGKNFVKIKSRGNDDPYFRDNTFKVFNKKLYTYLMFNKEDILIDIKQVSFNLEEAG